MKKVVFVIGIALSLVGFTNAQEQKTSGNKIAEGDTNTPFGKYSVELVKEPLMVDGEQVTRYMITYEKSPLSVIVVVDKEAKCKNYIVVSDGLSVMYKCNGQYFGINRIDEKYKKDGFVTDDKNLDNTKYFYQKIIGCCLHLVFR